MSPKTPRRWINHELVSHLPDGTLTVSVQESQLGPPGSCIFVRSVVKAVGIHWEIWLKNTQVLKVSVMICLT